MSAHATTMAQAPLKAALIGVGAWGRVLANAAGQSERSNSPAALAAIQTSLPRFRAIPAFLRAALTTCWPTRPSPRWCWRCRMNCISSLRTHAARAGKHIYIEKPIANTMADSIAVAALEPAHGVRIVVGHCARLLSGVRAMRTAIDAGTLGKITQIETNFSNDRGLRLSRDDWRWYSKSAPGGSLSQIGVHQFDTLRYLGGDIAAVSASAGRHSPVGAEVEDQWIVTVHFADGKLGTVVSSWTSPGTFNVRATGLDALMVYDIDQTYWASPERLHENATLYRQARGKGPAERQALPVPPGNMYRDELDMFADSVARNADCELSAANGCQAVAAVYAALTSAKEGSRAVTLNEIVDAAR